MRRIWGVVIALTKIPVLMENSSYNLSYLLITVLRIGWDFLIFNRVKA